MTEKNKVKFDLRNVHYGSITYDNLTNEITYGAPIKWPGAVSLTMDPAGDAVEFKADGVTYYYNQNNQGYTAELTVALIPDEFRVAHLGEEVDSTDQVQFETSDAKSAPFYFMYEVQGDAKNQRFVYYSCNAGRPSIAEDGTGTGEPSTEAMPFTVSPRSTDLMVRAKTLPGSTKYDNWFNAPWEPTAGA